VSATAWAAASGLAWGSAAWKEMELVWKEMELVWKEMELVWE
jgi:hypothetical protein